MKQHKFTVRTADYSRTVSADNHVHAAVKAFANNPPKSCGLLTSIARVGQHDDNECIWMNTIKLLERVGHTVEKEGEA